MIKKKYDTEFRKDHPETIGETDSQFDLDNYCDWLEKKYDRIKAVVLANVRYVTEPAEDEIEQACCKLVLKSFAWAKEDQIKDLTKVYVRVYTTIQKNIKEHQEAKECH